MNLQITMTITVDVHSQHRGMVLTGKTDEEARNIIRKAAESTLFHLVQHAFAPKKVTQNITTTL